MESKYIKYGLEELIEDKQFVAWVLKGSKNREWEKFIGINPEFRTKAKKAREIILLLRDTYEVLDEKDVLEMWQNIDRFDSIHSKKVLAIRLRKAVSRAAIILFVVTFSTLGYLYIRNSNRGYQFVENNPPSGQNDARLVLSSGKEIYLKNNNSKITVNAGEEMRIENDCVIDLRKQDKEVGDANRMNEVIIPFGKKSQLVLDDGTKVWLNAGSRLAFPTKFTKKNREVFLEGEAYFEVAHLKSQPFIVNAKDIEIEVLGTRFNLSAYPVDNNIETVLLEGSVALNKPSAFGLKRGQVVLQPNQIARLNKETQKISVADEPNVEIYIAWTKGWLEFYQESLHSVTTKLGRYYNVEIKIPEDYPSSELITGKIDLKESLEDVMGALADVAEIEYRINENTVYINKKLKELRMR